MAELPVVHVIDATRPALLRAGIKWDALERDHLDELHSIGDFESGKRRLKAIPQQLFTYRTALKVFNTFGLQRASEKVTHMLEMKEKEAEDLKAYIETEKIPSYDLDLCCFCYAPDRKLAGFVTPTLTEMYIESANYEPAFLHSGDELAGVNAVFDEELLINLFTVAPGIHRIFVLAVSFNYGFNEITGGEWALVNTKTEESMMGAAFHTEEPVRVYIMAKLTRGEDKTWKAEQVGKFLEIEANEKVLLQKRIDEAIGKNFPA